MEAPHRPLAITLLALAAGLVANALLGPLVLDVVDYPFSETVRNQAIGLEAVTLALVAPWCVVAAVLNWRGHRIGPALAIAPGGYAAYMMVQYIIGPNYVVAAHVVPLHLALFILGSVCAVAGWSLQDQRAFRPARSRWHVVLVAGIALFVVSRYIPQLAGATTEEPLTDELANDPAMFWTIFLLDLGVVVPIATTVAVALSRRHASATKGLYALLGWFTLVPVSVAAMAIVMLANDDPNKSVPTVVLLSTASVAFTAFAAWVHRTLTAPSRNPREPGSLAARK